MRFPLYLLFVWLAVAALAFGLASGWWDDHPIAQFLCVSIGATSTVLLPKVLRESPFRKGAVEPGRFFLVIVCVDFVSRMVILPSLMWLALGATQDGLWQNVLMWPLWLNNRSREVFPLLVLAAATLRLDGRVWKTVFLLLCALEAICAPPLAGIAVRHLSSQQFNLLAATISLVAVVLVAVACVFDVSTKTRKERTSLHWIGITVFALWTITRAWANMSLV